MKITENSAENVWKKALNFVLENGNDFLDKDGRMCREQLNCSLTIESVENVTKPIEIINSIGKWIYPPLEELESVVLNKKEIPGYYYNYGARAFNFNGLNQIDNYILPLLKADITTRRATLVFYDPNKDSFLLKKDVPGIFMINFNVQKNKLNASAIIRSNDLFFGWPANVYQTFVLQTYIANKLSLKLGSITTNSISGHIFEDQFENIKKIV